MQTGSGPVGPRSYIPDGEYLGQNASRQIILVMLLLCYHLWFQLHFPCPCNSSRNIVHCYSYMFLPCLIIASMIMWSDKRLGRIFRYLCYYSSATKRGCSCRGKSCCDIIIYVLQATASGFLWCASVLVDGGWYLCCGSSEEVMTVSCMEESKTGPAEQARKALMKNRSMVSKAPAAAPNVFHRTKLTKKTKKTVHNERCLLLIYLPGFGVSLHPADCILHVHFGPAVDEVVHGEKSLQGSVWREHTGPDRSYFAEGDEEHGCRCCEKVPDPSVHHSNCRQCIFPL